MDYRYGSHTVFQIEYHFVWVTKYRYKVLTGDEADQGANSEQAIRGVSASEEEVLGPAFLGTWVLLCDGGSDDGRDDQTISGASLRTKSERQFQDGAGVDASFRRRVSGLSVRKPQPTGFSRWLLI